MAASSTDGRPPILFRSAAIPSPGFGPTVAKKSTGQNERHLFLQELVSLSIENKMPKNSPKRPCKLSCAVNTEQSIERVKEGSNDGAAVRYSWRCYCRSSRGNVRDKEAVESPGSKISHFVDSLVHLKAALQLREAFATRPKEKLRNRCLESLGRQIARFTEPPTE